MAAQLQGEDEFAAAREQFAQMEAFLVSDEAHGKTHSELERELEQQGRELLRRLYQAHLERRAPGEATAAVRDSQGPCNRSSSDTSLATSSSLSLEIRCCIDRLNPHLKADIQVSRGKRHQVSTQTPIGGPPWSRTRRSPQPPSTSPGNAGRSWARLLRKVYEVDALECPQCGCRLRIIAVIEQRSVIQQILQHLDLWELPQRAPPPRLFPHKLETFLASLSPQQAQAVRASSDALFWDDVPIWED